MTLPAVPTDLEAELDAERTHLTASRDALRRMRERAEAMFAIGATVSGDPFGAESLGRALARRIAELSDDPSAPLFFGRLDMQSRRAVPHRAPARRRRPRRADGAGLARAAVPLVLPGQRPRPAGRLGPAPLRLAVLQHRHQHADLLRRRAPGPGRGTRHQVGDPDHRNRAPARRADARHRRHHPARAGRTGPRRSRHHDLRAGRARHRKDGRRPAPCRVPALPAPRTAAPGRRADRRSEPGVPALHRRRAAGPRRDRRGPVHRRGPAAHAGARRRDDPHVATIKHDARMADVLRRALWRRLRKTGGADRGVRRRRTAGGSRWTRCAGSSTTYAGRIRRTALGRERVRARVVSLLLRQAEARSGESPGEAWQRKMGKVKPVAEFLDWSWPAVTAEALCLDLLSDAGRLQRRPAACSPTRSRRRCVWSTAPRSARTTKWTAADAVLIDEAAEPDRAARRLRPRGARRSAGPLADAVPRDRPAHRARRHHAARRPGSGHRAVGRAGLAGHARAPRQGRARPWCR